MSVWFAISLGQIGTLYLKTEFNHIQSDPCHHGILGSQSNPKYFSTAKLKWSTCKRLLLKDHMTLLVTGLGCIPGVLLTFCTTEALGRKSTAKVLLSLRKSDAMYAHLCDHTMKFRPNNRIYSHKIKIVLQKIISLQKYMLNERSYYIFVNWSKKCTRWFLNQYLMLPSNLC